MHIEVQITPMEYKMKAVAKMKAAAKKKTKKMFSAVELMAVVAITATLASILVTSIKSSKDLAVQVTCMSNISQIRNFMELYRKDNNQLPYSEIWLTDFSFAQDYMGTGNDLKAFTCPGSDDEQLHEYSQLKYNTSYFYVPNASLWENNIEDGQPYGITAEELTVIRASENGVIYDKSPDHHNGKVNIARLFKGDDANYSKEGTIASINDTDQLIELAGDMTLDLPELADLDITDDDPAPSLGDAQGFALLAGSTVTVAATGTVITGHVGVSPGTSITGIPAGATLTGYSTTYSNTAEAIAAQASSNALYVDLVGRGPATAITAELGGTTVTPGTYSFSSSANIAAGTTLTLDGAGIYIFKVGSAITANVGSNVILQNGASPNQVFWQVTSAATLNGVTFSGTVVAQAAITLGVDATLWGRAWATTAGAVTLAGSSTVDSSNPGNSKDKDDKDDKDGNGNNGHGNNVDGVDSSNPGNSKDGEDSDPDVDDEKK
ncbi:MAG: type II secretory pathway pseudopilin PulG [Enterobacterales bacterium]|jgi:type II secretory pathway pseudopilin PulG